MNTGMTGCELAQHRRQQGIDAGRHETNRQATDRAAVCCAREVDRGVGTGEDVTRLLEEGGPGVCQPALPPCPREKLHTEFVLQASDCERQWGLGDREPLRSTTEVQFL